MGKDMVKRGSMKILFLEYKFRDFTDSELLLPKADGVIAALERITRSRWSQIERCFSWKGISFTSLPGGDVCPASDDAFNFLRTKIKSACRYKPDIIWFDHLRFEGHWEDPSSENLGFHKECQYCRGKDRSQLILALANRALGTITNRTKTGYFAVPFKREDYGWVANVLGQDHKKLGSIFDYVSPMLYHRMIGKPVSYISEYIQYLFGLGIKAEIIPIVQLKDMPDDLEDKITISEIQEEVMQAVTPPSVGVAFFSWDQAIEKNKIGPVSSFLMSI